MLSTDPDSASASSSPAPSTHIPRDLAQCHFDPAKMASFDLETTGTDPLTARVVTSAIVTINGKEVTRTEFLADPGIPIPEEATKVHGITTEQARLEGRPHDEVIDETIKLIRQCWAEGYSLVVFNAAYDLSILRALRSEFTVDGCVIDPLVLDQHFQPKRKGPRRLENLCEAYSVPLTNAHDATADALGAARLAWKISKQHPELTQLPVTELMELQAVAFAQWKMDLKAYFESQGRTVQDFSTAWPMRG